MRSAKGKMARSDAEEIIECSKMASSQVKESDASLILPIIARYGAGRLWQKGGSALGEIGAY